MSTSCNQSNSDDRRRDFRCPVIGPHAAARLRLGTREVVVELVDESSNGFAVVVNEAIRATVGEKFALQTTGGWVEVEVKNVQFQQWSTYDEQQGVVTNTRTRLGLLRLQDLEQFHGEETIRSRISLAGLKRLMSHMMPMGHPLASVAGLILGILICAGGLMWGLENAFVRERKVIKDLPEPKLMVEAPKPRVQPVERPKFKLPKFPKIPKIPKIPNMPWAAKTAIKKLKIREAPEHLLRMMSKSEALLRNDIAERLVLSPQQLAELEKIYKLPADQLTSATAGNRAMSDAERELEIARRGMSVLTETQRQTLLRILAEQHAHQSVLTGATETAPAGTPAPPQP